MASVEAGDEAGALSDLREMLSRGDTEVDAARTRHGCSALWIAASSGLHRIAQELLMAGADPNAASEDGEAALVAAAGDGDELMCQLLLEAGADPFAAVAKGKRLMGWRNARPGQTARELAEAIGFGGLASYLAEWERRHRASAEREALEGFCEAPAAQGARPRGI